MSEPSVRRGRPAARWHSLRWRLPLLISSIVALVVTAAIWAAYRQVELTLVRAGVYRAHAAAEQVASLLEGSVQKEVEPLRNAAASPALLSYLKHPTAEAHEASEAVLSSLGSAGPRWITLWDQAGTKVLSFVVAPTSGPGSARGRLPEPTHPPTPGVSALQPLAGEELFADTTVAVHDVSSSNADRRLGTLSIRSPAILGSRGTIRQLVGSDAVIGIGNQRGDLWTDLSHIEAAPPVDLTHEGIAHYRLANGDNHIGAVSVIRGAPWGVWVELPRAMVIAPARMFLRRMVVLGTLIVYVATILVRLVMGRVTTPLSEVSHAAEAVAAGDYARRVRADGRDEIGRLGEAFNVMAQQVGEAHQRLSARVQESHRLVEALGESEARTQFALAAGRMGVWELEPASGRLTWSDAMAAAFGLRPEQAPGTEAEFLELIHPDDRHLIGEAIKRAVAQTDGDLSVEFRTTWPDGSMHWMEGRARVASDEQGHPLRILGIVTDVSERKSLEEQLRQSQKMDAIGHLAGGVAHDFNNLLTAIMGYSDLLLEGLEPDHPAHSDVQEIRKAGESAAALTRQLLAFSRRQILQPEPVDLNDVVRRMESLLKRLIGEDIRLETALSPSLACVNADPGQIEQIILNLAVNARDAMPGGGQLTIETQNVDLDDAYLRQHVGSSPGPHVMLAVSDTGAGMDAQTQSRIFEPFFTTKERGKGTGLGLSMVYGIVQQSGGTIWVYSEPGRGATFKIYLRRIEDKVKRAVTLQPTTLEGSETVLLAEDQAQVRSVARTALVRHGYTVLDATSGDEALRIVQEHPGPVHLLITDVVMPSMNGRELVSRLQRLRPDIRVMYTSGYTDDAVVRHGVLAADVAFLQKPFTPAVLLRKVREILDPHADPTADQRRPSSGGRPSVSL